MIKHHLEGLKEGIVQNWNEIIIGKTPVLQNAIYYFSQMLVFLFGLGRWKREKLQIKMIFLFKKRRWATMLTNSSYEPPGTYILGSSKKAPKTTKSCVTFVTGVKPISWFLLRPWSNKWNQLATHCPFEIYFLVKENSKKESFSFK